MLKKYIQRSIALAALAISMNAFAIEVKLGISEFAPYSVNTPIIEATVKALEKALGPGNLKAKTLSVSKLQKAVETGTVDVILSSAGFFRKMAINGTGVRDLATAVSLHHPNPNYSDGSVFFVLKDRKDIQNLKDLKGKTVAANHSLGFSGWQTALGEIYRQGESPENFFGRILFQGHDMNLVPKAVDDGTVDVGIVRNCFLEDTGLLDSGKYKVINERKLGNLSDCVASTDLYPNWTISTLPSTPPEVSREIARALLEMPSTQNGLRWSIATDFTPIDNLFLNLRIGPYEYLKKFSFQRFFQKYWPFFMLGFVCVLGLILHSVTVGILVRRRTHALEEAHRREIFLIRESENITKRFEELQRAGVVGQMSSIIAHELRQPLGSIGTYCFALMRRIENGNADLKLIKDRLNDISEQSQKASAIVEEVRSYAKGKTQRESLDLGKLLEECVVDFRKSHKFSNTEIILSTKEPIFVFANPLEMELVFMNLLKNASEAVTSAPKGKILLKLENSENKAVVMVEDNGRPLTDEVWHLINGVSMRTTKTSGLGLGLPIVRTVIENHGGSLQFVRRENSGLKVVICLPICQGEKK